MVVPTFLDRILYGMWYRSTWRHRAECRGLVWVKFHIHSTTTRSEIIKLCEYCCLLYFSSLKLPLLPEHAGFVQAPLSCVSWALFSALLVLCPLHIKPTVYISMQKVAKRTLFLHSKHYREHRTCRSSTRGMGSVHYFSGRDVSLVKRA